MGLQDTARPMQNKLQTQTLSIRLPQELADRLGEVSTRYEMTRTAVLIEILAGAIDTYSPATHQQSILQHDTLSGAIEALRIELDETIERVDRLERATRLATQPAKQTAQSDGETFTTRELAARFGWDATNAARNARKNGWVEVGRSGRTVVWAKET